MRVHPTWLLLAALSWGGEAVAARHEVSFEYQGVAMGDRVYGRLYGMSGMHAFGLRGGYAVLRDASRFGVVIDAGWSRSRRASQVELFDDEARAYEDDQPLYATFVTDTFALGVKADVDVANVFYPYLHAQAALIVGSARLDDDERTTSNPNQLTDGGLAPAGLFTAGVELMVPDVKLDWPATFAIFFEAGYRVVGPLRAGDLGGELDLSGPIFRGGIGLRL